MKILSTIFKALLLLSAIGYLVFALFKISRPTGEMICTGVEYQYVDSDLVRLVDDDIIDKYMGHFKISPKGKAFDDIDIAGIGQKLSTMPYIDSINVYHTAAGKLCIRIIPYHPLLHIYAQDGDEFYVDEQGVIAPAGGCNTRLPIVTGHVTRKFASTRLIALGQFLRDNAYWNKQVEQININQKEEVEIIPRYVGQRILLGEPKDIAEKLNRVQLFHEKTLPKTGWNIYHTINASYKGQIICTKQ